MGEPGSVSSTRMVGDWPNKRPFVTVILGRSPIWLRNVTSHVAPLLSPSVRTTSTSPIDARFSSSRSMTAALASTEMWGVWWPRKVTRKSPRSSVPPLVVSVTSHVTSPFGVSRSPWTTTAAMSPSSWLNVRSMVMMPAPLLTATTTSHVSGSAAQCVRSSSWMSDCSEPEVTSKGVVTSSLWNCTWKIPPVASVIVIVCTSAAGAPFVVTMDWISFFTGSGSAAELGAIPGNITTL
mmetsp:Transcript_9292/g.32750  ORF Transcript_9292/g.32750 Transcript_9292/m.32750 type:complete len:237 (-) Transcript_9292:19-729(-)